ncbi:MULTISPECIES: PAS domain-containing protein [unclassified Methanoregula]|uniref:PAS domain-containing protein n=1 Tax=unclassified Methanoregula TaxID=2649730 RepID=UPI0009D46D47|nr:MULTISPECIES: PAS domain S-box protein [unclassified Methanoregula]OPX63156.1 MAG: putative diguanylate cyclase [Methanoregula sp. PtaB.Bin085]OPY33455.1 MAG: putative diguanylate cyclase [Methanoregula sp. PtaU1.Bin006]
MVLSREITARIREVLEKHPEGLSITDLVKSVDINRNTAGRYLENLLLSGQVEMRRFGMAKLYTLARRLPVSSVLSISSELVMQLDLSERVIYANDPLLAFLGVQAKDMSGKNISFTAFSLVFEDVFPELLERFRKGLRGEEWRGELSAPVRGSYFFCRVAPTVFNEGTKGVSVLLENITDQKRDEERIRRSEARLRGIFRVSPVGIGVERNRTFLEVNERLCRMTGYTASELVGKSARMLYPSEEEFERVGTLKYNQIQQNGTASIETRWVTKDGAGINIILNLTPLDPANISGGITFTALDITGRTLAEQALRESEARYRNLTEASHDLIFVIGKDDRVDYVNSYAAEVLGLPADRVIGKKRSLFFPGELGERQAQQLQRIFMTGKPAHSEGEMKINGTVHWFDHYLTPIMDARGEVTSVLGVSRDITARKQAEQALQESEERYRKLIEISPDAVILHRDGKIIYVNPAAVRLVGAGDSREVLGKNILDFVDPSFRGAVQRNIEDDLSGGTTPPMELQMLRLDGTPVVVEGRGVATSIEGMPAVLVAVNDITERYRAELAIRESEARYRAVFENTGAATIIIEENTIVSLVNSEFERISGYSRQELEKKRSWTEFVTKEDRERMLAWHYQRREGSDTPSQYEAGLVRKDGEIRRALITVGPVPGTTRSIVSVTDITDRKLIEEQLRQREQQYRFIADNSLDVITRLSNDFICLYVSPAVTRLLGYSEMEILGKNLISFVHPDDITPCWDLLDTSVRQGLQQLTITTRLRRQDGRYLPFESTIRVIRDEKSGRVREYLSISRDITARKPAGQEGGGD